MKIVRTTQPQEQTEIDWDNPLTRSLALFVDNGQQIYPSRPFQSITGMKIAPTHGRNQTFRAMGFGSVYGAGSSDIARTTVKTSNVLRSYIAWANRNGPGGSTYGRIFDKADGVTALSEESICYVPDGTILERYAFLRKIDGGYASFNIDGASSTGEWNVLGAVLDARVQGTHPRLYFNGLPVGLAVIYDATTPYVSTVGYFGIGNRDDGVLNRNFDGQVGPVLVFDRLLSNAEMWTLSINPWQLLKPERRTVFLPPVVTSTTWRWHRTPEPPIKRLGAARLNPMLPTPPDIVMLPSAGVVSSPMHVQHVDGAKRMVWSCGESSVLRLSDRITFQQDDTQNWRRMESSLLPLDGMDERLAFLVVFRRSRWGAHPSGARVSLVSARPDGYYCTGMTFEADDRLAVTSFNGSSITTGAISQRSFSDGDIHCVAMSAVGWTSSRMFVDGEFEGEGSNSGYANGSLVLGNHNLNGGQTGFEGDYFLAAAWGNKTLTDAELASYSANPWQLFTPDDRLSFINKQSLSRRPSRVIFI